MMLGGLDELGRTHHASASPMLVGAKRNGRVRPGLASKRIRLDRLSAAPVPAERRRATRYQSKMGFCARVEVWFEVDGLEPAEAQANAMETAAFEALRPVAVSAPGSNALSHFELEPADDEARAALAADDLGPGITSARFERRDLS